MLDILKKIKDIQKEADKIIEDAKLEAKKIKQGLDQKAIAANEETYRMEIAKAEKTAEELQTTSILGMDEEIKKLLSSAEQKAKEIEIKAEENYDKAVQEILGILFNRRLEI
jgi:V/A-type H+-transporting ATPase subunit G/H